MSNSTLSSTAPGWCLRFLSGAVRGRSIVLKAGTNVAGSAPDCQVLLPASDVLPKHLVFKVGELALSVQCAGTAEARINGEALGTARRSVVVGDVISVGKIDFQIERNYPANDAPDSMFMDADTAAATVAAQAAARPPRGRTRAWVVGITVWLVTLGGAWWAFSGNSADVRPATDPVNLASLEAALKDFPETELVAAPSGRMNIKGFVESQPRKQALQRAVLPLGDRVSVNVYSVEELIDQARRFVSDPGLAVTYDGKGRLVVSGKTEKADVQEKIHRLSEDLHPAVLVSDRVQYKPKPADTVAEQRDQWANWQRDLPARMVSVTEDAGGMRYIQLANGNIYFEGSQLKSGAELKNLRSDGTLAPPGVRR